jgi:hypothetical protein
MSLPDIIKGTYVSILVENPASPGAFLPICGVTTRRFTWQANNRDLFVRDCALPGSTPVRRVNITGEQWDLGADGLYNRAQGALIEGRKKITANYRFLLDQPADNLVYGGYYFGPAVLTQVQLGGSDEDMAAIGLTILSDGAWAWQTV